MSNKLSNIIQENGIGIDILKIDAHGAEYIILNDDDLNEKIKKEVVFAMYTLD